MSRELLKQALYALKYHSIQTRPIDLTNETIEALRQELANPEPAINPFPSFIRRRIEEAIDLAINPTGMSTHDGKATVYASDLQRMIAVIDLAPPRKPWVGLTDEEIELLVSQAREVPIEIPCESFTTRLAKLAEQTLKDKNT